MQLKRLKEALNLDWNVKPYLKWQVNTPSIGKPIAVFWTDLLKFSALCDSNHAQNVRYLSQLRPPLLWSELSYMACSYPMKLIDLANTHKPLQQDWDSL